MCFIPFGKFLPTPHAFSRHMNKVYTFLSFPNISQSYYSYHHIIIFISKVYTNSPLSKLNLFLSKTRSFVRYFQQSDSCMIEIFIIASYSNVDCQNRYLSPIVQVFSFLSKLEYMIMTCTKHCIRITLMFDAFAYQSYSNLVHVPFHHFLY